MRKVSELKTLQLACLSGKLHCKTEKVNFKKQWGNCCYKIYTVEQYSRKTVLVHKTWVRNTRHTKGEK